MKPEDFKDLVHDENNVKGFFNEYRYMSNFHLCEIKYDGITYPSVENAYQAAKTKDPVVRYNISKLSPADSKKAGNAVELIDFWDDIKFGVMLDLCRIKFQDPLLLDKLWSTGEKYLEETNWWKDTYWGVCDGVGSNKLGKILMSIRKTL